MNVHKSTSGFSLIELLIAMTIGLAILAVLGTVFSRTSSGRGDLERVSRMVENSRSAADIIGDDIRHAGFYGTFMPGSDVAFANNISPCDWNTGVLSTLGWQNTPPVYPAPLQGWNDLPAGSLTCLLNRVPGTDVIAIRRVSSIATPLASVLDTNVYVQASQCVSDPAPGVVVSNDDSAFILQTSKCDGTLAGIRRYFVRVYYLASCNVCTGDAADNIPTLKRFEVVDNDRRIASLAEGVQNLQFEYAVDALPAPPLLSDGVPEQMVTSTADWANVVGVRMHVLVRSSEPGLSADTTLTQYDLGPDHIGTGKTRQEALEDNEACPDRYRCRLLTTTFRLNNVAGRREK